MVSSPLLRIEVIHDLRNQILSYLKKKNLRDISVDTYDRERIRTEKGLPLFERKKLILNQNLVYLNVRLEKATQKSKEMKKIFKTQLRWKKDEPSLLALKKVLINSGAISENISNEIWLSNFLSKTNKQFNEHPKVPILWNDKVGATNLTRVINYLILTDTGDKYLFSKAKWKPTASTFLSSEGEIFKDLRVLAYNARKYKTKSDWFEIFKEDFNKHFPL